MSDLHYTEHSNSSKILPELTMAAVFVAAVGVGRSPCSPDVGN